MVVRRRRKSRKFRGSRTHGYGRVGQHRKGGSRGGKGHATGRKHGHMWSYIIKYEPNRFGKHGFNRPQKLVKEPRTINIGELDEKIDSLLENKIAEYEGDQIVIDVMKLDLDKVLGKGKITRPLIVKAKSFTMSAIKKIEEAGGKAIVIH
ncbi:MAG: uL15 family ribosomal protein [Candidatus Baldrarchaeia archaeon]